MSAKQQQHNPPQIKVDKMDVDESAPAGATAGNTSTAGGNILGAAGNGTSEATQNDFQQTGGGNAVDETANAENDPLGFFCISLCWKLKSK
jgi:hypothetical protein